MHQPRLLHQVRTTAALRHLSPRTTEAYAQWIKRFLRLNDKRHPKVSLRVKDIDLDRRLITVRRGKGEKDRVTMPPHNGLPSLQHQIETVREIHRRDLSENCAGVTFPESLDMSSKRVPETAPEIKLQNQPTLGVCHGITHVEQGM